MFIGKFSNKIDEISNNGIQNYLKFITRTNPPF